jgi:hypothetical protein
LHNKPQGCGASVASAAGPFSTRKKSYRNIYYIKKSKYTLFARVLRDVENM